MTSIDILKNKRKVNQFFTSKHDNPDSNMVYGCVDFIIFQKHVYFPENGQYWTTEVLNNEQKEIHRQP